MKKENLILWIASFIITFLVVYLSNLFSSNYPISGTIGIEGQKVSYRFEKIHYGKEDVSVLIRSDLKDLSGKLFWKAETDSVWNSKDMKGDDLVLSASFPSAKIETKTNYYIELSYKDKNLFVPDNQKVGIEFFAKIPTMVNVLQFLFLYLGLLLAVRTGLEYFNKQEKIKKFEIFIAIIFLTLTALVNPLYLTYKYGFINKTVPSITRLFPAKELLLTVLWIASIIITFNVKKYKIIPLISAIITIIIFAFFS